VNRVVINVGGNDGIVSLDKPAPRHLSRAEALAAFQPTPHDLERQRLAALKRARQIARIRKGFRHGT
jgi:hypothetical protein